MSEHSFGIDLGTSTSVISHIVNGRPTPIADPFTKSMIVPSVVGINRRGELLAGQNAIDEALPDQIVREAKRYMGTDHKFKLGVHQLLPEQIGALVLKKMKANAEMSLGMELTQAVITVPAYFDDLPRRATERAAQEAGIPPIRLISEPVAAALSYGIDRLEEEGMLLVYDFGGGTLDVTIIDMMAGVLEVKATDGDKALGGKDIDEALMNFVIAKAGKAVPAPGSKSWEQLKVAVERAKKSLSAQSEVDVYIPNLDSNGSLYDLDVTLSRDELETTIQPLVARSIQKIESAIVKAKLKKDQIQRLLLVGGTCYIPKVRESVEKYFGIIAQSGVDPDLAVSMGAAFSAGLKTGAIDSRSSIVAQDAATFRMGTTSLGLVGEQYMKLFSELMPANAPIPFFRTERFNLIHLDQDEVKIDVLQDPSGVAKLAADAIPTGAEGIIKDIPPSTTGEPRAVDVEFKYDENQIIRITGKVVGLDKMVTIQLNSEQARPNLLQSLGGVSVVDTIWENSPLATRNAPLIKRAEKVLESNPAKAELIEAALEDLKASVARKDADGTQTAREKLTDLLAEL